MPPICANVKHPPSRRAHQEQPMTETPAFDPDRGYTLTRRFDAPRAVVWQAITQPDLFAQWWGTEAAPVDVHQWDLKQGGTWHATMHYEGNELPWSGRFEEIDEPERLVFTVTDAPEVGDAFELMTFTLTEEGDKTDLVLRQSGGSLSDEEYGQAKEGTGSFLDAMAVVVARLRG
jgi:uncharacterized protein YndB with AHSA1/START domain